MRVCNCILIIVSILLPTAVFAQTSQNSGYAPIGGSVSGTQQYPWRSSAPATGTSNANSAYLVQGQNGLRNNQSTIPNSQNAPAPPRMDQQALFAAARTMRQDVPTPATNQQQTQPSLSDAGAYEFNNVPDTPQTDYYPVQQSQEPGLMVPDNSRPANDPGPNYCYRDCRKPCQLGCVKRLFGTTPSGVEVGGWAQFGYHNRDNIMFNNRRTEFNPHQIWMYAEKAACRDSTGWDIGYRLDALYGIDAQDVQAFGNSPTGAPDGWDNDWDHGAFGSALPQAYVQASNCNWDVKLGKFFSPFGYETVAATGNFFYSHSFSSYYNQPFTMSGVLGERRVSDRQSYIFGATAGWDTAFESNDSGFNLITGTRLKLNPNVNVALTSSLGDTGSPGSGVFSSAVTEVRMTQDIQYVLALNSYNLNTSHSYSMVHYLFRQINPCLALGARLEWWKSDLLFADTKSTYEFTMGVNYRPKANLIIRPEVRFDWGAAAINPGEPIVGFDAIILF